MFNLGDPWASQVDTKNKLSRLTYYLALPANVQVTASSQIAMWHKPMYQPLRRLEEESHRLKKKFKKRAVVIAQHLLSTYEVLGSIPSREDRGKKKDLEQTWLWILNSIDVRY